MSILCVLTLILLYCFILIGRYITPVISGQPPPPCYSFTFNKVTDNSGILYGGYTSNGASSIVYITKLTKNTVVSLYTCMHSTLQKIWCYFPTNIGVFLSQIVHPHHISEVKHIDGYVTTYILCLVINIQIYVVVARPILFFTMLFRAFYDKGGC